MYPFCPSMVVLNLSQNLLRLEAQSLCSGIDSWRSLFRQGRNTKLKTTIGNRIVTVHKIFWGDLFRERNTNKQEQLFGIVPGTGGVKFLYVFSLSLSWEKENHTNKIPTKSQDNPGTIR